MRVTAVLGVCLCLLVWAVPVKAQESVGFDGPTKEVCNRVMLDIFHDIVGAKDRYKELSGFGEESLFANKYGIYTLIYNYQRGAQEGQPYSFALTIDQMKDKTFKPRYGSFELTFPVLGIKFSGYQPQRPLRSQFNLLPLLDRYGAELAEHQQNYLPLRLFLQPGKAVYKVREEIEFTAILRNVSKRNVVVKDLNENTLYFLINGAAWGTRNPRKVSRQKGIILRPGEELSLPMRGDGFLLPQEVEINGLYRVSLDGVNPTGVLKIRVEE